MCASHLCVLFGEDMLLCLFKSFAYFKITLFIFLWLCYRHSLYIVAINPLSEIFAHVFYHSVGFLFTSWLFLSIRFFNSHYCNWIYWWLNKYFMWLSPQVRSVILQRLCLAFKSLVSTKCLPMNERIDRASQVTRLSQSCTTSKRQHKNRKSGFWILLLSQWLLVHFQISS